MASLFWRTAPPYCLTNCGHWCTARRRVAHLAAIGPAIVEWRQILYHVLWSSQAQRRLSLSGHAAGNGTRWSAARTLSAAADALEGEQQSLRTAAKASAATNVGRSRWTTLALIAISPPMRIVVVVVIREYNAPAA